MLKNAPILLLTYRKHEFLKEIFKEISKYSPSKLYVFLNKEKNTSERELVEKVKGEITDFNFTFEVEFVQHPIHLPISQSYFTAMEYVFSLEVEIIVLEDDVIPNLSFFEFCNLMLEKYQNYDDVGCINGCNLNAVYEPNTYFYSYISVPYWGWATWRSKWLKNRSDNFYWNHHSNEILEKVLIENRSYFTSIFDSNADKLNVWDLQWNLSLMANNLKTILPGANLIVNKGFIPSGTTINYTHSKFNNLPIHVFSKEEVVELDKNPTHCKLYEMKIVELFKEITSNLKGSGKDRLLSRGK